jgi:cyclopropane fatty-acyl-phospholipid synthase-like methyltransferase
MTNMNVKSDLRTAPGYEVLAAAGKKILRPGGRLATSQLLAWAGFQPGETVLELASSFGISAINLAKTYGVKVVGVEKDINSIALACRNIQAAGLTGQVKIIEGDIFHLEEISGHFDYILAEAILTMQSIPLKAKILNQIKLHLKPGGGKFLAHELLARKNIEEIHRELSKVNHVNATPLSENGWINACENAGLKVQKSQIGAMKILNPIDIIKDEGITDIGKIFWNLLRHKIIRDRVLEMKNVFQKYHEDLGYIILCAE